MSEVMAAARIIEKGRVIALTGAGISTESGIPDFRSADGLWSRYDPLEYGTIRAFQRNPEKVWKMLFEMADVVTRASPNPGHEALAELERMGLLEGVVTQNIDGLHQRAGSQLVVELHGGAERLVCSCGFKTGTDRVTPPDVPRCAICGAVLKPDVVFFGEPMPSEPLQMAFDLAGTCQTVLVIGTSATVSPASEIPVMAKHNGAKLIEFNLEQTPLSRLADLCLVGKASQTLSAVVADLRRIRSLHYD